MLMLMWREMKKLRVVEMKKADLLNLSENHEAFVNIKFKCVT